MTIKSTYTLAEAAKITGLREKMIDYLCRTQIVIPNGSKHKGKGRGRIRRFTFADLLLLQTLKRLLAQGISVARLKDSLKGLRGQLTNVKYEDDLIARFIITDGKHAYFRDDTSLISLTEIEGQYVFRFVVDMEMTRKEVILEIEKLKVI